MLIVEIFLLYFYNIFLKKLWQTLHYVIVNSVECHPISFHLISMSPTMQIRVKHVQGRDDHGVLLCTVCFRYGQLKICQGCRQAWYCSRRCQKRDWKKRSHKYMCRRIIKLKEAQAVNKDLPPLIDQSSEEEWNANFTCEELTSEFKINLIYFWNNVGIMLEA